MGLLVCGRAWWLCRQFERERSQIVTPYIRRTSTLRVWRLLGYTIVGLISIAIFFAYPLTRRSLYHFYPLLLQLSSLFTLLLLLAAPITDTLIGYWTLKFLLHDPLPKGEPRKPVRRKSK